MEKKKETHEKSGRGLDRLLRVARTRPESDEFWDEYLQEVVATARRRGMATGGLLAHVGRYLVPAAAAIALFFVVQSGFFTGGEQEEPLYTATIDFVLEEHDYIMSQHMFDPTPFYAVEEVALTSFDESNVVKN